MWVCGAARKVAGENTMTKLMPRLCQSTVRRLATVAVRLRPSTFTVTWSPSFEPHPVGDALLERHQGWSLIVRRPPLSGDQARAGRDFVAVGDAAVALQRPAGVGRWLEVFGRDALRRHDASAQHGHALERRARRARVNEGVEPVGLGGRDVDEVE